MFSVKNMTVFALAAVATVAPAAAETRIRRPRGERREREEDAPRLREGVYGDEAGAYGEVAGAYGDVAGAYGDDVCDFSILDAVIATPDLFTLGVAVEAAGLSETVSDPALTVTVLAPNNDAFAELDEDLLASLLEQPEALSAILGLHIIPGIQAFSRDLTDGMVVTTLAGGELTIGVSDEGVTFTTEAGTVGSVVTADIPVCSSIVHIIDTVLL